LLDSLFEILKTHEQTLWLLGLASAVLFIGTALLVPLLIMLLPEGYFARQHGRHEFSRRHPIVTVVIFICRNAVGAALLVAGIIMLFTPGQGLLTILVALALVDFPGKHALLGRMTRNPRLFDAANGIRRWAGKPEFIRTRPDADRQGSAE
jgi:MFS family permease